MTDSKPIILAAVEGGGTSFCVAVAMVESQTATKNNDDPKSNIPKILHCTEIDSSHDNPQLTIEECVKFFKKHKPVDGYNALGIANFGPLGVNPNRSRQYGKILSSSPKQSWRNVDLLTPLKNACQGEGANPLPSIVETDVNAPALAEYLHVRQQFISSKRESTEKKPSNVDHDDINDISSLAYITVGTGVGVGLVVNGKPVHGRMHPELGHIPIQPLDNDTFKGYSWGVETCPFQGKNTVEGITSSVALTERLQAKIMEETIEGTKDSSTKTITNCTLNRDILSTLSDDDKIWDHAANAVANLCTVLLLFSIERIVIGGGIMKRKGLIEKIRTRTVSLVNGYLELPSNGDMIDNKNKMSDLITGSTYGNDAGLIGAVVLAQRAYQEGQQVGRAAAISQPVTTATTAKQKSLFFPFFAGIGDFNAGFFHGIVVSGTIIATYLAINNARRTK